MYYLGMDTSGKYAKIIMQDENGKVLGRHSGSSFDMAGAPGEAASRANILIKELTRLTNTVLKDCKGLSVVVKNFVPEHEEAILNMFNKMGIPRYMVSVYGAERALLAAKIGGSAGALLYSGEDVSGYVWKGGNEKDDKEVFVGNYGILAETGGSSYSIGINILRRSIKSLDGRIGKTVLLDNISSDLGIKPEELPMFIRSKSFTRKYVHGFAAHLSKAAGEGDSAAIEIEKNAAMELALFGMNLLPKSGDTPCKNLVLGGPTLLINERLRGQVSVILANKLPDVSILVGDEKAELGAVMLARVNSEN